MDSRNRFKILIADDEEIVIDGLLDNIDWEKLNLSVCATSINGLDAYAKAVELKPQIILTDIRMPKMNGLELIEKIRLINPGTVFLIFSGYSEFEYAKKSIELDVINYILKPSSIEEISSALKKAVAKSIDIIRQKDEKILLNELSRRVQISEFVEKTKDESYDEQETSDIEHPDSYSDKIIEKVKNYIRKNYSADISLQMLADLVHVSPAYLSSLFKKKTDINISEYLLEIRMNQAKIMLRETELKIWEIAEKSGYYNQRYFCDVFKKYCKITASEYRDLYSNIQNI